MNFQSLYEQVNLRENDILGFILPGSISLVGIYILAQTFGIERWEKTLPFLSNSIIITLLLASMSFLVGHILDMLYRLVYQRRPLFQRLWVLDRILIGTSDRKSVENHIASQTRLAVGKFLNIDWNKTPIEQWIRSGKMHEISVLLAYWVEEEDPKLFSSEIGRPILQAHMLHVCGIAFCFVGICALISWSIYLMEINSLQHDLSVLAIIALGSFMFGFLLIRQGIHKRDVIIEHTFRLFYVVWRKRTLKQ